MINREIDTFGPVEDALPDETGDWSEFEPLGDQTEFAAMMEDLVAVSAPGLFAIVREVGERADGWVLAWGLEMEPGHVEIVEIDGTRGSAVSPEAALRRYDRDYKAHVVHYTRDAAPGTVE
ncbi:hypothetical protein HUO13_30610 [Saccharopolyspora erythraea]|uniref:hypothetical protein n=1 Tax=Saccharopolyspora erythraea TaxID=1836 RepID=UPI001BAC0693|nr:hypothetical protein [Saccharopolyspora erythraea]QUH04552.1 hypothetical protein HUO13_30610 [Saccharopolyspora erythraea]